jgi:predicted dehydrogenase
MPQNRPVREILIAGLGSIGRRHLANLQALGWPHIRLYRTGKSTQSDANLAGYPVDHDLQTALARRPLAVVVSNPSALHVPLALAAVRADCHVLIEKPLSDDLDGIAELELEVAHRGLAALVGFQFRFNPGLQQIRSWLRQGEIGAVVSVQAHYGEYLPDMHPWEDYRVGYAARADLGGGALLTLCHPFDYLRWLIGDIKDVSAIESRRDALGLLVDTCVNVTARFGCGALADVHLNLVERPSNHQLTVIGTEGTITWNESDSSARRYHAASRCWETVRAPHGFERNWMFLDEMRHFLSCLRGEQESRCSLADGRAALAVALAAKRSITGARSPAHAL